MSTEIVMLCLLHIGKKDTPTSIFPKVNHSFISLSSHQQQYDRPTSSQFHEKFTAVRVLYLDLIMYQYGYRKKFATYSFFVITLPDSKLLSQNKVSGQKLLNITKWRGLDCPCERHWHCSHITVCLLLCSTQACPAVWKGKLEDKLIS